MAVFDPARGTALRTTGKLDVVHVSRIETGMVVSTDGAGSGIRDWACRFLVPCGRVRLLSSWSAIINLRSEISTVVRAVGRTAVPAVGRTVGWTTGPTMVSTVGQAEGFTVIRTAGATVGRTVRRTMAPTTGWTVGGTVDPTVG
jgi:hypothetical protein